MKKKISLLITITLILQLVLNVFSNISYATSTNKTKNGKRNSESYWSKTNAPVFYGSTKITIKQGLIAEFDALDSRFRVFAMDFEDGDLTPEIKYSGEVNVNEVNTYEITYTVTDSHKNTSSLVVPVIVTDEPDAKITVERTLYTTPSVWNMDLAEFYRCNYGDRQLFGVFLGANQSIKARILSSEVNLRVDFMNNDSNTESSTTIPQSGDWVTIQNIKDNFGYDSVPLIRTPVLSRANTEINKTYKIELEYDETIPSLNYYHYLDNEENYRQEWIKSQNSYSVIESETLLLVVPLTDISYMTNYYANGFASLDKFLEYYQKVIEKMDEYIGLDFNPVKITDQNVRTKYVIKANANGVGAAYYAGDHVGVNNASMRSFFEMNWGGLHELAHGYQGSLGKGEMQLGEVSNNILGYYIQTDKSIYDKPGNWLGELPVIEESRNAERLSGKNFLEIDEPARLYVIINLFDSFEGPTTYAKMFSWYREQLNNGRTMTNQDAYVEAIADIHNVNILPYMDAWGLNISDEVKSKVYESNYPLINILGDMANSNDLSQIMSGEGIDRKYSLVSNDVLKKYGINSNATVDIEIDDISELQGKIALLKNGKDIIESYAIDDFTLELADVPIGTYYLQMPILYGYSQKHLYIQVKQDANNTYTYTYENLEETPYDNYLKIRLLGYNFDTIAYQLVFKDNYTKAQVSYPNQSMMSGNESVKIYNSEGSIVEQYNTVGGYFDFDRGTHEIDLKPGYKIEITYPDKYLTKVVAYNTLLNNVVPEYGAIGSTTTYTVINNGLLREDMNEEDADELAYNNLKDYLVSIIEDYASRVTEKELSNKNINFAEKTVIINAYEQLKDDDKIPYTDLINKIRRGGVPKITVIASNLEYEVGTNVNLYGLIKATDNEDGNIEINKNSTTINTKFDNQKPDTYDVTYNVKDSDNNVSSQTLQIKIIADPDDEDDNEITPPVAPPVPDEGEDGDGGIPPVTPPGNGGNPDTGLPPDKEEDDDTNLPPEVDGGEDDSDEELPPGSDDEEDKDEILPPGSEEDGDEDEVLPPGSEEDGDEDVVLPPSGDNNETSGGSDIVPPTGNGVAPPTKDEILEDSSSNSTNDNSTKNNNANSDSIAVPVIEEEPVFATAPTETDEEDFINTSDLNEIIVPDLEETNEEEIIENSENNNSSKNNTEIKIVVGVLVVTAICFISIVLLHKKK